MLSQSGSSGHHDLRSPNRVDGSDKLDLNASGTEIYLLPPKQFWPVGAGPVIFAAVGPYRLSEFTSLIL
jgi:hypothetical protein